MVAAAVAAMGVPGAVPAAVASASPHQQALDWTMLSPPVHPSGRAEMSMAYDAANDTVVLFGGCATGGEIADTWTWNGTTWTKQHPAVHPTAECAAPMAYDAATGTVVLSGGDGTWTWNGTTWTKQLPATSPPRCSCGSMVYDAATGTVVLFGGENSQGVLLNYTWTWNGTTWTKQHPATSPPAQASAGTAYDAATGTVVLFGGDGTWTWNGTTWTEQAPATSPPARELPYMAYDAAARTVVLFGGAILPRQCLSGDTWTWDGTTWTEQAPAHHPSARGGGAMVYDAATGTVVLFGGFEMYRPCNANFEYFHQTWTLG